MDSITKRMNILLDRQASDPVLDRINEKMEEYPWLMINWNFKVMDIIFEGRISENYPTELEFKFTDVFMVSMRCDSGFEVESDEYQGDFIKEELDPEFNRKYQVEVGYKKYVIADIYFIVAKGVSILKME